MLLGELVPGAASSGIGMPRLQIGVAAASLCRCGSANQIRQQYQSLWKTQGEYIMPAQISQEKKEVRHTMRAILQRVRQGRVTVDGQIVGEIGPGYVILLGVTHQDGPAEATKLAEKTANLRVFEDEQGKMNLSALDTSAEMLVISQFTLFAETKKGRRPSFTRAASPEIAEPLVTRFAESLRRLGVQKVETGIFGAMMLVHIENDGPVTIILDTDEL
jgi:D-tyrosyl-tRNA(Tyr) deacylase